MNALRPETILSCAPALRVRLFAGVTSVQLQRRQINGGPHALAILDAFTVPAAFGAVVERLRTRVNSKAEWLDLVATIMEFHRTGVLREPGSADELSEDAVGYSEIRRHLAMLGDRDRTGSWTSAVGVVVRPDDVVVDIGTGSGVLAIAAAAAGARHVYAIEATNMADLARRIVQDSGHAERITVLRGWSSAVTLPERAGVLVSELIGHEPLSEGMLSVVIDARRRLLNDHPRFVPHRLRILATAVSLPDDERNALLPTPVNLQNWEEWYGIDARALRDVLLNRSCEVRLSHERGRRLTILTQPAVVADLDMANADSPVVNGSARVTGLAEGDIDAVMIHFEADLAPEITVSSQPDVASAGHWGNPVFLMQQPVHVEPGVAVEIDYAYRPGEPVRASARKSE
jgi:hypothetical protein